MAQQCRTVLWIRNREIFECVPTDHQQQQKKYLRAIRIEFDELFILHYRLTQCKYSRIQLFSTEANNKLSINLFFEKKKSRAEPNETYRGGKKGNFVEIHIVWVNVKLIFEKNLWYEVCTWTPSPFRICNRKILSRKTNNIKKASEPNTRRKKKSLWRESGCSISSEREEFFFSPIIIIFEIYIIHKYTRMCHTKIN